MDIDSSQRRKLKKFVKELSEYRALHTELVTVYVPAGYDLNKVIGQLSDELGTATNIKSTSTRKNVQAALEKMIQHLKIYKGTPSNGLVAFSGNVASKEGKDDVRVWSLEPPIPVNQRIYRCEKTFVLDLIEDMVQDKVSYGLVVVDRRDATIAMLKGKSIVTLTTTHSHVPGKFKAGGQSSNRFRRLIEGAAKEHYRKVAEYMKEQFFGMDLKGIIIGGPGPTKHDFLELGQLTNDLKKKVIAVKDLSYTGDFGLHELVDKSQDVLAREEIALEKSCMNDFFSRLAKTPDKVTYGKDLVLKSIEVGAAETVLLSEILDDDIIDKYQDESDKMGTKLVVISTQTREGTQLKDMGGYAAILRFPLP